MGAWEFGFVFCFGFLGCWCVPLYPILPSPTSHSPLHPFHTLTPPTTPLLPHFHRPLELPTDEMSVTLALLRGLKASSDDSSSSSSSSSSSLPPRRRGSGGIVVGKKRKRRGGKGCEYCGREFGDSSTLRRHIGTVHLGKRRFRCGECKKLFGQKGSLLMHLRHIHLNERRFGCDHCEYRAKTRTVLHSHILYS